MWKYDRLFLLSIILLLVGEYALAQPSFKCLKVVDSVNGNAELCIQETNENGLQLSGFSDIGRKISETGKAIGNSVVNTVETTSELAGGVIVGAVEGVSHIAGDLVGLIEREILTPFDNDPHPRWTQPWLWWLESEARGKLKEIPKPLIEILDEHYPRINWHQLRYDEDNAAAKVMYNNSATTHCTRIYFPRNVDFSLRLDLEWLLHELEHVDQCKETGSIWAYFGVYIRDYGSTILQKTWRWVKSGGGNTGHVLPISVHDNAVFEINAENKALALIDSVWSQIDPAVNPVLNQQIKDLSLTYTNDACLYKDANKDFSLGCFSHDLKVDLSDDQEKINTIVDDINFIDLPQGKEIKICQSSELQAPCKTYTGAGNLINISAENFPDGQSISKSAKTFFIHDIPSIKDAYRKYMKKDPPDRDIIKIKDKLEKGDKSLDKISKSIWRRRRLFPILFH